MWVDGCDQSLEARNENDTNTQGGEANTEGAEDPLQNIEVGLPVNTPNYIETLRVVRFACACG